MVKMPSIHICRVPAGVISAIAVLSNIVMVISILADNGTKKSFYVMLLSAGATNAVASLLMAPLTFQSQNVLHNDVNKREVANACLAFLLLLQFHVNLGLAYDRYLAVSRPLLYRAGLGLRRSKRWLIIGTMLILVISGISGYLNASYPSLNLLPIAVGCVRFITFVSLSIIYCLLLREYRKSQATVTVNDASSSIQTAAYKIRQTNEKNMTYKCLGITASFIILNLPLAISRICFPDAWDCSTLGGVLIAIGITMNACNRVFDPVWYFYMERKRKLQTSRNRVIRLDQGTGRDN